MDDPQAADALDPGIHDEVSGRFAALGVDVVHMVVEGDLVPFLGHLQQVMLLELAADDAGLARSGHPEIVGQLQLAPRIAVSSNQAFHDLQEHSSRVLGHGAFGGVDHFQTQGPQGVQSLLHSADFKRAQKLRHRIRRAQSFGLRHLLDAVGVKIREVQLAGELRSTQDIVDDLDQLVVLAVEQASRNLRWGFHFRKRTVSLCLNRGKLFNFTLTYIGRRGNDDRLIRMVPATDRHRPLPVDIASFDIFYRWGNIMHAHSAVPIRTRLREAPAKEFK